jgi:hypothetical protein
MWESGGKTHLAPQILPEHATDRVSARTGLARTAAACAVGDEAFVEQSGRKPPQMTANDTAGKAVRLLATNRLYLYSLAGDPGW